MARFWTSDWHFNHANIIEFTDRPFWQEIPQTIGSAWAPDTDAMNDTLIDNCNDLVGPGDELWLVGDAAMGNRKTSVPLFKRLRCRNLILVPGNHDHCHRMHKNWERFVPLYEDAGFTVMDSQVTVNIAGQEVLVCHFPYTGDSHGEDRYSGLRPDDDGHTWLIHGHTHSPGFVHYERRQLHVGVDAHNYFPVPESVIEDTIRETV